RTKRGALSSYFWGTRPLNMCAGSMTWSSTLTRIKSSSLITSPWLFSKPTPPHRLSAHEVEYQPLAELGFLEPGGVGLQVLGPHLGGAGAVPLGCRRYELCEESLGVAVGLA